MRRIHVVIRCDHPKCPASVSAPSHPGALNLAAKAGWALTNDRQDTDYCPKHAKEIHQ